MPRSFIPNIVLREKVPPVGESKLVLTISHPSKTFMSNQEVNIKIRLL